MAKPTRIAFPPGTTAVAGEKPGTLREFSMPAVAEVEPWMNIGWLFKRRVDENPQQIVIEQKSLLGQSWRKLSAQEFWDEISATARGLLGIGLKPGDRLAILGPTSYDWTLIDMAALSIGIVVVPIYETDSASQIEWILKDAEVHYAIAHNQSAMELINAVSNAAGHRCKVYSLAAGAMLEIVEAGRKLAPALVDTHNQNVNLDSLATIIYTSGTTGKPKGVKITHGVAVHLILNGLIYMEELGNKKSTRSLLFLPLAHAYARLVQWFTLAGPGVLGLVPDTRNLLVDLASFRPTYVLAVPRVLEKIYNAADAKAGHGFKLRIFRAAAKTAIDYSKALDDEKGPSSTLKWRHRFFSSLVLSKITSLLGGNAQYIISGGGPLGTRLGHFFRGIGVTVCEGYGLTETLGPVAVNVPHASRIGSVGQPIPGGRVRVDENGEIQLYGNSLTPGYLNNPQADSELYTEDGWLRTGDKGWIDQDGFIYINGRIKEIIVTAGGKNVAPEVLEDKLRGHPLISNVVVVGDRRPFIAALVTLDAEMLPGWLQNHSLPPMDVSDASRHPVILRALEKAVERANASVSRAESIRKIQVLNTDFTLENGMMTPSLKVKRAVVTKRFQTEIDQIYGGALEQ